MKNLYQRLKPKAKKTLCSNATKYELSTEEIVKLLTKATIEYLLMQI